MENALREKLNYQYRLVRRLAREFSNPERTATDSEISQTIADINRDIQELLREDLTAQGIDFDPDGPSLYECEHCGRAVQFVPDHECWGTKAEAAELRRNEGLDDNPRLCVGFGTDLDE